MIAALLLAAGVGRRFGRQKLLVPLGTIPLVRHAARRLIDEPVDDVIVVGGADREELRDALAGLAVRIVDAGGGRPAMSASLRAGMLALPAAAQAVVVALGDEPTVPAGVVARSIDIWRRERSPIVVPVYDGHPGHPVLFDLTLRDELLAVEGDVGARPIIARDAARVRHFAVASPRPRDVDTEDDMARAERELFPAATGGS
ncbi:MAG: nucleotidyltransferase family protein [Gemmatimonadaceae bacterium]